MGLYVINIGDASAKQWVQLAYEHTLNGMSTCQIALDGVLSNYASEFDVDKEINIYKGGTLQFSGKVTDQELLSGGGIILYGFGIEIELADEKSPMVGSATTRVWTSTSDHTILSTLVTSVGTWAIDTSNSTSEDVDFRTSATESVWNAVINLISQTGKDIWIDQENKVVYLYDEYTRASQFSFIEGQNASNITRKKSRSKAGKVIIYGKGDGDNQIIGSNGSGTPVYSYIDRNIISTTEANARALKEYNKINPQLKRYSLTPITQIDSLQVGDSGNIANNSAGINEEVDIVRIKIVVDNQGIENVNLEVTNPDYRIASKNVAEERAKSEANYVQSQTSMQGSGNTLTFSEMINANSSAPLRIYGYFPADYIQDQAGNIRVNSFTLDYDVDPYRKGVGSASEDNKAPDVENSSGYTEPDVEDSSGYTQPDVEDSSGYTQPDVEDSSGYKATYDSVGSDSYSTVSCSSGSWTTVAIVRPGGSYLNQTILAEIGIMGSSGGAEDIEIRLGNDNYYGYIEPGLVGGGATMWGAYSDGFRDTSMIKISGINVGGVSSSTQEIFLQVRPQTGAIDLTCGLWLSSFKHNHDAGSYNAKNHLHDAGSYNAINHLHDAGGYNAKNHLHDRGNYNAISHNHDVSIGDGVSDSGSVNASELSTIKLYHWNGSSWDLKNTISNTGKTIDFDVDLSSGGTYPDAVGFWQVEILTDNANADLVQGILKCKHNIDN